MNGYWDNNDNISKPYKVNHCNNIVEFCVNIIRCELVSYHSLLNGTNNKKWLFRNLHRHWVRGQTKSLTNKYYYIVRGDDWVFGIVDSVYSVRNENVPTLRLVNKICLLSGMWRIVPIVTKDGHVRDVLIEPMNIFLRGRDFPNT